MNIDFTKRINMPELLSEKAKSHHKRVKMARNGVKNDTLPLQLT